MDTGTRVVRFGFIIAVFGGLFGITSPGVAVVLVGLLFMAGKRRLSLGLDARSYWPFGAMMLLLLVMAWPSPYPEVAGLRAVGFALTATAFVFGPGLAGLDQDFLRRRLLPTLVAGSALMYFSAVAYYFLALAPMQPFLPYRVRATTGALGSPGLGTMVVLATGISLGYLMALKTRWRFLAAGAYFVLASTALVLSVSRGAWLGFLGMLAVLILVGRMNRRWVIFGTGALAVVVGLSPFLRGHLLSSFILAQHSHRLLIWRTAIKLGLTHPLTGVGTGAFSYAYHRAVQVPPPLDVAGTAHNLFLTIFAEAGVIGLVLALLIAVKVLGRAYRLAVEGDPLLQGMFASLIGALIHLQVDNPVWALEMGGFFWLLCGLTLATGTCSYVRPTRNEVARPC